MAEAILFEKQEMDMLERSLKENGIDILNGIDTVENERVKDDTYEREKDVMSQGIKKRRKIMVTKFEKEVDCDKDSLISNELQIHSNLKMYQNYYKEWIPHHVHFVNYSDRYKTFKTWPTQCKPLPDELSKAGFFYTNIGDKVCCFYCNIRVYEWKARHNAIKEHRFASPACKFVHMVCDYEI